MVVKKDEKVTKKPKAVKDDKLQKENQFLKEQLEEMKKMILNLNTTSVTKTETVEVVEDKIEENNEYVEIKPNKYIKVISLENNHLILSTEGYGKGKKYLFTKFGEVKNIIYSELVEIIHHQQSFAEAGRFYIVDKNVVKNHGLIENYTKILNKETIENIIEFDKKEMIDIFTNATQPQKETIVSLLLDKIRNKEDVDLNKVDSLSRIFGKNISEMIEEETPQE